MTGVLHDARVWSRGANPLWQDLHYSHVCGKTTELNASEIAELYAATQSVASIPRLADYSISLCYREANKDRGCSALPPKTFAAPDSSSQVTGTEAFADQC